MHILKHVGLASVLVTSLVALSGCESASRSRSRRSLRDVNQFKSVTTGATAAASGITSVILKTASVAGICKPFSAIRSALSAWVTIIM